MKLLTINPTVPAVTQSILAQNPKKYSLWLMPQENDAAKLQTQIDALAENRGPKFAPHVTVIGGIWFKSEDEAIDWAHKLQKGLEGFGEISCDFDKTPYYSEGVWSQALCATMEPSEPFLDLCRKARLILNGDSDNWTFPYPICLPHLSLFYGTENVPQKEDVKPVPSFRSDMLALWETNPSTLEGVPEWKEIVRINLQ